MRLVKFDEYICYYDFPLLSISLKPDSTTSSGSSRILWDKDEAACVALAPVPYRYSLNFVILKVYERSIDLN